MQVAFSSMGQSKRYEYAIQFAAKQVRSLITNLPDFFPMYTAGGRWKHGKESWTDWCSGFLAGLLWQLSRMTGEPEWRAKAEHFSKLLEPRQYDRKVHDLGFIFLNSYRPWYAAAGDPACMDVVAQAGVTLAGRFQSKGQYLASFLGPHSLFVDIMMNVPLLFVAADWLEKEQRPPLKMLSNGQTIVEPEEIAGELRRVAVAHCETSLKYLVRPDGSSVHEAIFDTATGEFLRESTQQGLRADSCWSRGLAWSLYGFGTVYRHTGNAKFLHAACRGADYFLRRLPPSRVPYWDFDVPEGPQRIYDSSAASIATSGLLQLSRVLRENGGTGRPHSPTVVANHAGNVTSPDSDRYHQAAIEILNALCDDSDDGFLAARTPGWEGILRHAVYHIHKNLGVDESVMWGDYFFVEALADTSA